MIGSLEQHVGLLTSERDALALERDALAEQNAALQQQLADDDGDGAPNAVDGCAATPPGAGTDRHGCSDAQRCEAIAIVDADSRRACLQTTSEAGRRICRVQRDRAAESAELPKVWRCEAR